MLPHPIIAICTLSAFHSITLYIHSLSTKLTVSNFAIFSVLFSIPPSSVKIPRNRNRTQQTRNVQVGKAGQRRQARVLVVH